MILRPDRPANGGEAVGRLDGRVVFVRDAIPGELVRARVVDDSQKRFVRAEAVEILEPSPHRVDPVCDAARHGAGCCDLVYVSIEHARELKAAVIGDALARIGGFGADVLADLGVARDMVAGLGDAGTGWRVRTRLGIGADGRAGMHARHGSGIIAGHECAAPEAGMLSGLDDLELTPGGDLVVVADMNGDRHITELAPPRPVGRSGRRGARGTAQAVRRRRAEPRAQRVVVGAAAAAHRVGGRVWQIPVTGFWQAHREAPAVYGQTVVAMIAAAGGVGRGLVWDLYGGAGVFAGATLDAAGAQVGAVAAVHVVDSDAAALAAAEATFADEPVEVHHGEVSAAATGLPTPDVVILDPPRTGAGAAVIGVVADADPDVIVHVGCDIGRFARDLALFADHGYRVQEIRAFDAFPLTHHVEAVAALVPAHRRR
ncbi:class I SAM-dependent RNA methyltransferase [Gordonia sp. HNM0687]|uniref:Class I SAM-dependent RNA methyltransferase n=1 Tax=Gordonia mangrovi TaxID=2665643 RepID=A0A6L7GR03_9ACTN|nr:class I SAM-dependent RNA methyltransferase [Gordonia mangrovi]MXP22330.1 class I SAM-dependent RNA methyltransferase [Gordonia mangrovi]UVF80873.1 class I SAM-dependent RNA methyltransferase [Gordonia mangrovi]